MHRQNFMSKSTKRRRLLEETANLITEQLPEIPPILNPSSIIISNVSVNANSDDNNSNSGNIVQNIIL